MHASAIISKPSKKLGVGGVGGGGYGVGGGGMKDHSIHSPSLSSPYSRKSSYYDPNSKLRQLQFAAAASSSPAASTDLFRGFLDPSFIPHQTHHLGSSSNNTNKVRKPRAESSALRPRAIIGLASRKGSTGNTATPTYNNRSHPLSTMLGNNDNNNVRSSAQGSPVINMGYPKERAATTTTTTRNNNNNNSAIASSDFPSSRLPFNLEALIDANSTPKTRLIQRRKRIRDQKQPVSAIIRTTEQIPGRILSHDQSRLKTVRKKKLSSKGKEMANVLELARQEIEDLLGPRLSIPPSSERIYRNHHHSNKSSSINNNHNSPKKQQQLLMEQVHYISSQPEPRFHLPSSALKSLEEDDESLSTKPTCPVDYPILNETSFQEPHHPHHHHHQQMSNNSDTMSYNNSSNCCGGNSWMNTRDRDSITPVVSSNLEPNLTSASSASLSEPSSYYNPPSSHRLPPRKKQSPLAQLKRKNTNNNAPTSGGNVNHSLSSSGGRESNNKSLQRKQQQQQQQPLDALKSPLGNNVSDVRRKLPEAISPQVNNNNIIDSSNSSSLLPGPRPVIIRTEEVGVNTFNQDSGISPTVFLEKRCQTVQEPKPLHSCTSTQVIVAHPMEIQTGESLTALDVAPDKLLAGVEGECQTEVAYPDPVVPQVLSEAPVELGDSFTQTDAMIKRRKKRAPAPPSSACSNKDEEALPLPSLFLSLEEEANSEQLEESEEAKAESDSNNNSIPEDIQSGDIPEEEEEETLLQDQVEIINNEIFKELQSEMLLELDEAAPEAGGAVPSPPDIAAAVAESSLLMAVDDDEDEPVGSKGCPCLDDLLCSFGDIQEPSGVLVVAANESCAESVGNVKPHDRDSRPLLLSSECSVAGSVAGAGGGPDDVSRSSIIGGVGSSCQTVGVSGMAKTWSFTAYNHPASLGSPGSSTPPTNNNNNNNNEKGQQFTAISHTATECESLASTTSTQTVHEASAQSESYLSEDTTGTGYWYDDSGAEITDPLDGARGLLEFSENIRQMFNNEVVESALHSFTTTMTALTEIVTEMVSPEDGGSDDSEEGSADEPEDPSSQQQQQQQQLREQIEIMCQGSNTEERDMYLDLQPTEQQQQQPQQRLSTENFRYCDIDPTLSETSVG